MTPGLLGWVDQIFVLETRHRDRLQQQYAAVIVNKPLTVLDIPDPYTYREAALVELLHTRLSDYLD